LLLARRAGRRDLVIREGSPSREVGWRPRGRGTARDSGDTGDSSGRDASPTARHRWCLTGEDGTLSSELGTGYFLGVPPLGALPG
jgi:hypothetical protein